MPALSLSPAERRSYRAAAHHLHPVVAVGADGLTAAVIKETDAALRAHGLIKLKVHSDDRGARDAMLERLADELSAAPVQHIGKQLVLWRPQPAKPPAEREGRRAGPKVVKLVKFSKSGNHRPQVKKVTVLGNQRITAGGSIKRAKKRAVGVKKAAQAD